MVPGEVKSGDKIFASTGSIGNLRPNSIKKRKDQVTKKLVLLAFVAALALNAGAQTETEINKVVGRNARHKIGPIAPKPVANATTTNSGSLTKWVGPTAPKVWRVSPSAPLGEAVLIQNVGVNAPKVGPTAPKVGPKAPIKSADLTQKVGAHAPIFSGGRGGRK